MREYGQIQTSFWTDPELQSLSESARLFAAYLLTGPHSNGIGCYRLPDGYITADFGWSPETINERVCEIVSIGFFKRCETTFFVLIPKFLRWNPIANANVALARVKEVALVPRKFPYYNELIESLDSYGNHWPKGYIDGLRNGLGNKNQPYPEKNQPYPEGSSEGFEDFWSAWPKSARKGGKADCLARWIRHGLPAQRVEILAHVAAMKDSADWRKDGGAFIPAPAVYLNQRRWDGAEIEAVRGEANVTILE